MDLNTTRSIKPWKTFNTNRATWWKFIGVTLAIIAIAFAGSLWTLYMLSATAGGVKLREKLGINNVNGINVQSTRTDKIIIEESSAVIEANKKVGPAVVSILSTAQGSINPFTGQALTQQSSGTGFIVTSDGLIATNKHVVKGGQSFTVTTADGKTFDGTVVATDPTNDLALMKVEARGLPVADLGDSDRVEVGQYVIAIGNALGEFQNTVTLGVISAENRTASPADSSGNIEMLDGLFQTDAAINPGNSGGPLLNLAGQVIGMNTAVASGNAQGIGFALPVNDLKRDLESYNKTGKILQSYIGVGVKSITKAIAKSAKLPVDQGAYVVNVVTGSPAAAVGIKADDIITQVNKDKITETSPLPRTIHRYNPNDKVTLTLLRDKKEMTLEVTLGELGR
ncbi:MAG: trypsin-like peptidase domain-containing protein [Patescibacteria group bacterium]